MHRIPLLFVLALFVYAPLARGEEAPPPAPASPLEERILALEKAIAEERTERAAAEARLRALEEELLALKSAAAEPPAAPAPLPSPAPAAPPPLSAEAPLPAPAPSGPQPVTLLSGAGGKNFLNLSLDALVSVGTSTSPDVERLEPGGHDPLQRGFTVQNVEVVFDGAVDPYLRGQANLIWKLDADGESVVELEELFGTTSSLPHGLQLKAGHFLTEFGRLNATHPHSWDFADEPLVNARMFGGDGLRAPGARLSWLVPTRFYSEAILAVQNSGGETLPSFRGVAGETAFGRELQESPVATLGDLLFAPRYTASFDVGENQTVLLGASAAFGPNGTGEDARTRILGLDFFWKWKAAEAQKGFPFVKLQLEAMRRSYEAAAADLLPARDFQDWGAYAQLSWGWTPMWVLGFRLERVAGDEGDPLEESLLARWRASTAVTWFPTEYSKLRLQYNYDDMEGYGPDHSLWLQFEFLLGAHAAHKF